MGSATIRRIALVAAILLLAPVWCRPAAASRALDELRPALASFAPGAGGSVAAIRRQSTGGGWSAAARADHGRNLALVGLLSLLALIGLAPWASVRALRTAPLSLHRRRHVISLRAPPLRLGY